MDSGIRRLVGLFRKRGFVTVMSCIGGKGHIFKDPTIGLLGYNLPLVQTIIAKGFNQAFRRIKIEKVTVADNKNHVFDIYYLTIPAGHLRDFEREIATLPKAEHKKRLRA